ncbi:unnamed protein product [Closterium sp. Yama58-4]|nr:unnamed protein product [Closterium sp. Yama58-4]
MFVRHTRSSTAVPDRQKDLPVVVFASRKSKTNATNRLTHQFLARHINFALCGVGGLFLWIHFVYDLVPLRFGADIIPPLDFSDPLQWSKKHIFFPLRHGREQLQEELPYVTHNNWINWVMNEVAQPPWRISKKTHAFRRSGAQGLSDDRCPDPDINALGGWEQGEMRKSYVVGVPFWPVLMMAGFSGEPGDYYVGRAHAKLDNPTEWEQLQDLFKLFIFPRLESDLAKGVKDDTGDKKMKRMRNVMLTVEKYKANESEEATRDAIAKIQKDVVDRSSISALADGVILGNEPPPKRDNPGKDKTTENKRRKVGYLFFAAQMEGDAWGEKMFGEDVWKQIKIDEPKKLAKLKK